jgi:hypothetical protein
MWRRPLAVNRPLLSYACSGRTQLSINIGTFIGVDGRGVLVQVARVRSHVPRLEVNHLVVESQFHCFSSVAKLLSSF